MTTARKAICGVLAVVMLLCAISAAADFTDGENIRNLDAVTMLTELGVVSGFPDGSFMPEEPVTREQAAKMIASILQKKDNSFTWNGELSFSDSSLWANEYIEYCAQKGIIAGYSDGTFDPGGYITGDQMFKLLLVAVGYDPSPYVGEAWLENVRRDAKDNRLDDGLNVESTEPLTRDNACLLIFNALKCRVITGYIDGQPLYALDDLMNPKTVLEYYFDARLYTEIVTGNEFADLAEANSRLEKGVTKIAGHKEFECSTGMEYLGRQVNIYISDDGQVLGEPVFSERDLVITFDSGSDFDEYYNLSQLAIDDETQYYLNYNAATFSIIGELDENSSVTVIDRDGNGTIDVLLVTRFREVTITGKDDIGWLIQETAFGGQLEFDLLYEPAEFEVGETVKAAMIGGQIHIK